jgi:integrase
MAESARLTDAGIRRYRPGAEQRRIRDTGADSLFLIIEPSGHKAWQMRFRTKSGRIGKMTLGPVHNGEEITGPPVIGMPLTLAGAHQVAAEVHRQRALGQDPVADHKARKHRQRTELAVAAKNTFAAAVHDYVTDHAKQKQRRWKETARLLGLHADSLDPIPDGLAQRWHEKPVAEIDDHDIWSAVDEARRRAVPGLDARNEGMSEARARKLHTALGALFAWLKRQRRITSNPCAGLHRPAAPMARERTLSNDEIQWFWHACAAVGEPFGSIFKLLLLTGSRLAEVAGMSRAELLGQDNTWRLPGSRTKNHRAHVVPLSSAAQAIITAVPDVHEIIFSTTGRSPPSGWSRAKRRLDQEMRKLVQQERGGSATIPPFRLHDLRRTCVTGMAELSVAPHVIELVVNHVSGSRAGVAGVYNKAELLPERRAALERWAVHVQALVSGRAANIVVLRA